MNKWVDWPLFKCEIKVSINEFTKFIFEGCADIWLMKGNQMKPTAAAERRAAFWKRGRRAGGGGACCWPPNEYGGGEKGGGLEAPAAAGGGVVGLDAAVETAFCCCCCDVVIVDWLPLVKWLLCDSLASLEPLPEDAWARPFTRRLSAVLNSDPNWSCWIQSNPESKMLINQWKCFGFLPVRRWFLPCTWIRRWWQGRWSSFLAWWRLDWVQDVLGKAVQSRYCRPTAPSGEVRKAKKKEK